MNEYGDIYLYLLTLKNISVELNKHSKNIILFSAIKIFSNFYNKTDLHRNSPCIWCMKNEKKEKWMLGKKKRKCDSKKGMAVCKKKKKRWSNSTSKTTSDSLNSLYRYSIPFPHFLLLLSNSSITFLH